MPLNWPAAGHAVKVHDDVIEGTDVIDVIIPLTSVAGAVLTPDWVTSLSA